ncbi:hypothetical protein QQ045_008340 [Rhodiola kirilowii]
MITSDQDHQYRPKRCTSTKFFFCLLLGTLIHIVLLLTIFQAILHVRYPKATISNITIQHLHVNFSSSPLQTMKLATQVTLHNPTLGNLRFGNGTLVFLYVDSPIGSGFITEVRVKGRSIKMLNIITTLINFESVAKHDIRSFSDDIESGVLPLAARLKLDGEIHLMKVIRRKSIVETHCALLVNLVLQDIQSVKCK